MMTNEENLTSPEINQPNIPSTGKKEQMRQFLSQALGKMSWRRWAVILILMFGGIGFTATSMLLRLPKAPQCSSIFWPIASASLRLYCAQLEADQGTVESLLKAINLVESLPPDHPLRHEINDNVEQWSVQILALAEEQFQKGKLEEAIAIAGKIPPQVKAYKLVDEKIAHWQSIWEEGAAIVAAVEVQLRDSSWNQAFREAVKLLNLDNQYWATSKYDEVSKKIHLAREESTQLDSAYSIFRRGGLDNWLKAITEAEKILPSSYAYQEAQKLIGKIKDKLLANVNELIDKRDWQSLLNLANRLPESLSLKTEIADWKSLASAGLDADTGTVDSLQTAIIAAQQINSSSPVYQDAQDLIARWKQEIEGVTTLAKARQLSQAGNVNDLNAAIAQAQLVASSNPRYQEARGEINTWNRQIQTLEDQPFLDRAREFARNGSVTSLQEAISQASLINPNRALYKQAQQEIYQWRTSIEEQQDQPFLDQAIALANTKDYNSAIDTAQQIRRGRALYRQAQRNIGRWQREIQAQVDLQEAYLTAEGKTPEALSAALKILRRIPNATDVKEQGLQALNTWSEQLLAMANEQASVLALSEAIRLARMIPPESASYGTARANITTWKQQLAPPSPSPSPEVSPSLTPN